MKAGLILTPTMTIKGNKLIVKANKDQLKETVASYIYLYDKQSSPKKAKLYGDSISAFVINELFNDKNLVVSTQNFDKIQEIGIIATSEPFSLLIGNALGLYFTTKQIDYHRFSVVKLVSPVFSISVPVGLISRITAELNARKTLVKRSFGNEKKR